MFHKHLVFCTLHTPDIFLILLICLSFPTLQARDIYEEAIMTVITVRDFTQVFDAYAQFEKNLISSKMESMEDTGASEEGQCFYCHCLVCNYLGLYIPYIFFYRYVRHSWQKWKHYLSLEYKFRYCPSITLKLHFCLYIIVNHNYPSFSLWEDFAFVMNLISYVLYLSSK